MGSGMMSNAALVSGVRPVTVAVSVYPVPGLSMRRSEKVAAPLTARALVVPVSAAQLAMSAIRARTDRVFIAADGRCKGRTGPPPWNSRRSRLGDLNRLDTPAESKQQVWARHGRMVRRTAGAVSRER